MKNNHSIINKILQTIGRVLSILSVVFIVYKIYKIGFDFSQVDDVSGFIGVVCIAILLKMISVVTSSYAWGSWIAFFSGKRISFFEAFIIYGKSGIGKYLPGNVMHYVGRNVFAAGYGLPQKKIALGSVVEAGELLLTSLLISLVFLPASFRNEVLLLINGRKTSFFIVCIIAFVLTIAVICYAIINRDKTKELFENYKTTDFVKTVIQSLIGYSVTLFLLGSGMVLLWMYCEKSIPSMETVRLIISSFSTAWVCGFIIPGASGGIGVREAILSVLLKKTTTEPLLLFIIVSHRLITIIGDFAIYAVVTLFRYDRMNV